MVQGHRAMEALLPRVREPVDERFMKTVVAFLQGEE